MTSIIKADNISTVSGSGNINLSTNMLLPTGVTITGTDQASFVAPKQMIQYEYRNAANTGFNATSSSMVDVTNFYVNITPKYSNSLLIFECTLDSKGDSGSNYARYRVVDSLNSDTQVSTNVYIGQSNYYAGTSEWTTTALRNVFISGTTNTMRLQLQMQLNSGGNFEMNWSGSDNRVVQVTEIAQ